MTIEDYLLPPSGRTWQWCDDDDAIQWDATTLAGLPNTIAFSQQLLRTLSSLHRMHDGLPSLATVLVLESVVAERIPITSMESIIGELMDGQANLQAITDYLRTISAASLKSKSADTVAELIGFGLADSRQWLRSAVSGADAEAVLAWLALDPDDRDPLQASRVSRSLRRRRQQHLRETMVYLAKTGWDQQSFESWKRIGSKDIPASTEEDFEEPPPMMLDLIRSLKQDEQLSGLATAASHATSVMTIPRQPSHNNAMPMGGVSDITNRGTPDRLLMTELAADPLLLAARIATGQALYVRRETPPTNMPGRRAVLVEQSVRTWGSVRFSMTAVAMAISCLDQRRGSIDTEVWSVSGDRLHEEQLHHREGIMSLLERVEPTLLPLEALESHKESIADSNQEDWSTPCWVVCKATFQDPLMKDFIRNLQRAVCIASVSDDGKVIVWEASAMGCEEVQRFELDSSVASKDLPHNLSEELPIFVSRDVSPLRWTVASGPVWIDAKASSTEASRVMVWTIMPDLRLLYFDAQSVAGLQVCDRLPSSQVVAHRLDDQNAMFVLRGSSADDWIVRVRLDDMHVRMDRVERDNDAVTYETTPDYLIQVRNQSYRWSTWVDIEKRLSWQTVGQSQQFVGEGVFTIDDEVRIFDPQADLHGRFLLSIPFKSVEGVCLAVRTSTEVPAQKDDQPSLNLLSDSGSHVLVLKDLEIEVRAVKRIIGKARSPTLPSGDELQREYPVVIASDRFNQKVFLRWGKSARAPTDRIQANDKHLRVDLRQRTIQATSTPAESAFDLLEADLRGNLPRREIRKRVSAVNVLAGVVYFQKRAGETLQISPNHQGILQIERSEVRQPVVAFGEPKALAPRSVGGDRSLASPTETQWRLRLATLDGGWVWLDSRGLLHFKRRDDVDELTLVLDCKHVSGWFSASGPFGLELYRPGTRTAASGYTAVPKVVTRWLEDWGQA